MDKIKKNFTFFVKIIITTLVFVYLFYRIPFSSVNISVAKVKIFWLLIAICLGFLQSWVSMLRWHFLLKFVKIHQPIQCSLKIFWVSMFFNSFVPTGIAGDALRIWMLRQRGVETSAVFSSVMLDRLFGILLLIITIWLSIPAVQKLIGFSPLIYFFRLTAIFSLLMLLLLGYLHKLHFPWGRYQILQAVYQLSRDTRLLWRSWYQFLLLSLIAIIGLILQILDIYFLSRSLDLNVSLIQYFRLIPPVIFMASLPISVGGWGLREGAMVTFLSLIGVSSSAALALSIVFGLTVLLVSLPGGIAWIIWKNEQKLKTAKKSLLSVQ